MFLTLSRHTQGSDDTPEKHQQRRIVKAAPPVRSAFIDVEAEFCFCSFPPLLIRYLHCQQFDRVYSSDDLPATPDSSDDEDEDDEEGSQASLREFLVEGIENRPWSMCSNHT